jgi:alpha-N-acetylglucosamine transferase
MNNVTFKHKHSVWTLLTDGENYANAVLKLLLSVQQNTHVGFDFLVLEQSNKKISESVKQKILSKGGQLCQVERIPPRDENGPLLRFLDQLTKLRIWEMTEFESCIYFDLDCLVVKNIDHMFNVHKLFDPNKHKIGVSQDIAGGQWLSTFNMGVFVVRPNQTEFERLMKLKADSNFKFPAIMGDQGFMNEVFKDQWYEIGFEYNANLAAYSQKREFWDKRARNISVIHYTMSKPWECTGEYKEVCDLWRNVTI